MESIFALVPSSMMGNRVGEIVSQDVARDGDGVLAGARARHRLFDRIDRRLDGDVQSGEVVIGGGTRSPWR